MNDELINEFHQMKKDNINFTKNVSNQLLEIRGDTSSLKEHTGRNLVITSLLWVLAGIVLGMNFDKWKPIAKDVYNTVDVIKEARQ